jgi:hypothetical protein
LLNASPSEKGIFLRIAELHYSQMNISAACEALRKEFEQNQGAKSDWTLRAIVDAWGIWESFEEAEVKEFLRSNPAHAQFIESVLGGYWPSFSCLSETAREEWIFGTKEMHSSRTEPFFSHVHLRKAVAAFATAVETELKSRVFAKFKREFTSRGSRGGGESLKGGSKLGPFYRYLNGDDGRLTLGEMCEALEACRKPQEEALRQLRQKLDAWKVDLNRVPMLLGSIVSARNSAVHPDPSAGNQESAMAAKLCREFLDPLIDQGKPKLTG